ncbi:MAG: tryptophan-rich sensory protein [Clostridia bacterium]|nr:tryptophan-rich sensory protein [Clostridia bacterium]
MKIQWKKLLIAVAIPLAVGGLASLISSGAMQAFGELNQPPLSPPAWLFPVVWTLLYVLMGIASYRVYISFSPEIEKKNALFVYCLQLAFNFFWTIIFFNFQAYLFAFLWLLILWILILITFLRFRKIDKPAGLMLLPYLAWVAFAGYLNFGIYLLN